MIAIQTSRPFRFGNNAHAVARFFGFLPALLATAAFVILSAACKGETVAQTAVPAEQWEPDPAGLQPFEDQTSGRFGYRSSDGAVVIEPRFLFAMPFSRGGIAAAGAEDGWIYINREGDEVLRPFVYDNGPDYPSEGLARFEDEGRIGFHDAAGRIIIPARWDFAEPFTEGRASVCLGCKRKAIGEHFMMEGGEWGAINARGELVVPLAARAGDRRE
jgi:WG containing repeat